MRPPLRLAIRSQPDVERARREARALARSLGISKEEIEAVVLAASELATNLLRYAQDGEMILSIAEGPRGQGVEVESHDKGPGIADLVSAMKDGFSTGGGLGSGLPAVQRLMDDFAITTGPTGTMILVRKWKVKS